VIETTKCEPDGPVLW